MGLFPRRRINQSWYCVDEEGWRMRMEYVNWECKDCGWQWVGDLTDTWCPICDERNIVSTSHVIKE